MVLNLCFQIECFRSDFLPELPQTKFIVGNCPVLSDDGASTTKEVDFFEPRDWQ